MTAEHQRKYHHGARPAFTLIELLVVIGIIAVLAAMLVTGIPRIRRAAQTASTTAQLAAIATAMENYHGVFAAYPGPLPNTQVGVLYWGNGQIPNVVGLNGVPVNITSFPGGRENKITGAENLVLGLLGGLVVQFDQTNNTILYRYDATRIFPNQSDPTTPGPKGPLNLYYAKPGTRDAYLQVKTGDISHPNVLAGTPGYDPNNPDGRFTDSASRMADDTCIPEFVDQYSEQLPILYVRANQGAPAICAVGGRDKVGGTNLTDPTTGAQVQAQYDLSGIVQYTQDTSANSGIGTKATDPYLSHHGLQGTGLGADNPMTDTIDGGQKNNGQNALAYFKDPSSPTTPNTAGSQNVGGTPRQKNGYILISAGPDRVYGTSDDVIYPGSLNP